MPSGVPSTFGEVLRRYRQGAGLSQDELALKTGLSTRAISDLERGVNRSPRKATLTLLADGLGLSPQERRTLEAGAHAPTPPPPHNLPAPLTSFIGREAEMAAITQLLGRPDGRLVTLTGPGGSGKTRLALEVAASLLTEFGHGVWFVDLSPLTDPALVISTIAQVLGVQEAGDPSVTERLQGYVRDKHLLLVLDNCEQVVAAGPQVSALLQAAPGLQVLATSRVALRLRGEKRVAVPPLALPDAQQSSLEELAQSEAVRLFAARAREVDGAFAMTAANARAVAEICVRLDGLPLALELAAARILVLPPQAMLTRLASRLDLLTSGPQDLPARQQTLRAALAWSYDLLSVGEQGLFRRLAVFAGGAPLAAISALGSGADGREVDVLEGLRALVEGNLLRQMEGWAGEPRFVMLETIGEYAQERLAAQGEQPAARRDHAEYFVALAEEAEAALQGPQQTHWLERLEQEYANLRRSLQAGATPAEYRVALGLRLAGALKFFWEAHSHLNEGRAWLATLLARGQPGAGTKPAMTVLAKALDAAARLAYKQADPAAAQRLYSESLELERQLQSPSGISRALLGLGHLARVHKDLGAARAYYEEALALRRALGDKGNISSALFVLGQTAMEQGAIDSAARLYEESLILSRELGDQEGVAYAQEALGQVALVRDDYEQAIRYTEAAAVLYRAQGNKTDIADAVDTLGWLAMHSGDYSRAAPLLEEAVALYQEAEGNPTTIAGPLARLGIVAAQQGDPIRAKALLEQSLALLRVREPPAPEAIGLCLWGFAALAGVADQPERMAWLTGAAEAAYETASTLDRAFAQGQFTPKMLTARARLDEAAWEAAWVAGRAMTLEQVIAYALEQTG